MEDEGRLTDSCHTPPETFLTSGNWFRGHPLSGASGEKSATPAGATFVS
jgi:hypothetical protein